MKLICYLKDRPSLNVRPASVRRDWMDKTPEKFAYRCLPLNIANMHGWEICCDEAVEAVWNGGSQLSDIQILKGRSMAVSHFGSGVLTFHVSCVLRTMPGWNLLAMGSPNRPKRGIQPLTGIIETDWAPYSFTMNWIFTEANYHIKFEKYEPFCFFFPIQRGVVDQIEPVFCNINTNPELDRQHTEWTISRSNFNKDLLDPNSTATQQKWQRNYYRGQNINGEENTEEHQMKVRPRPFAIEV